MIYKTLTTIVDDCASFVIHMPWRELPRQTIVVKVNITFQTDRRLYSSLFECYSPSPRLLPR